MPAILGKNMQNARRAREPLTSGNPANLGTDAVDVKRCSLGCFGMKLVIVTAAVLRDLRRMSERRVKCRMFKRYHCDLINIVDLRRRY